MATIKKREGKTGVSYLIRVSGGYDVSGNQVVHSMTWKPEPGMKPKQIEKELQRQAVLFEEQCAGIISIRRTSLYTKEKGVFTDTTKTARSQRTLKLPPGVFEVLKKHRAAQAEERLRLVDVWHDTDRLFVNWDGQPMHPNTPYHWLRRFCEETRQRFLGVHQFRHLNATLLISSGTDARTVSAALGHSQVSTTLNIYTHTFAEAQARAGEAVAAALERSISKTG